MNDLLTKLGLGKLDERQARVAMALGLAAIILIGVVSLLPPEGRVGGADPQAGKPASANRAGAEVTSPETDHGESGLDELSRYARELEERVQSTLSRVGGAGRVWVTISMQQSASSEFATDKTTQSRTVSERDSSGGVKSTTESTTTATVVSMDGSEDGAAPVLVKKGRTSHRPECWWWLKAQ